MQAKSNALIGRWQELFNCLSDWREHAHKEDPFFPHTWLIDDDNIELISKTHPTKLQSLQDLVDLLGETEDWASDYGIKIFEIITQFEQNLKLQATSSQLHATCRSELNNPRQVKQAKGITFFSIQTPDTFSTSM